MLNSSAQIRDFGRLLPWVASPSQHSDERGRLGDIVTPAALRQMSLARRSAVGAALVRMCDDRASLLVAMLRKMTVEIGEFSTRDPRSLVDDLADPHGEVTESCEATEAYFRAERNDLAGVRRALSSSPDSNTDDPEVLAALDRLDDAFRLAVGCMQEARWLVLMANGGRGAPASNRTFASGPELLATIEAETEGTGSHTGTN